ncbi:tetratricopeptide repeat protein [Ferrigenium sp. UT5]|uniref:tetratricopeptide repeat protein n=1 Tax=Ferrigenium sp. UT5 TaxID=3242105 RepID=UPI0035531400
MSLINQVLNELEQRGAHTAPDQTLIRAVPRRKEQRWIKWALFAVLLAGIVALTLSRLPDRQERQAEVEVSGSVAPSQVDTVASPSEVSAALAQPASKLSYELSLLPLPDSLRTADEPSPARKPLVAGIAADEGTGEPAATIASRPPVMRSERALPLKKISPTQRADAEYRKGLQARQAGQTPEALAAFEAALKTNEGHEQARFALAALLLDNGQAAAAERVLQAGLQLKPLRLDFAMALARMQIEQDALPRAVETLQAYLAQADDNADYQAFYAALLQRQQRHKEAVNHYQLALRMQPRNGIWLMGYGISLQAAARIEDAQLAYRQALATQTLSPELGAFVQQKLKELKPDTPSQ